ncbi:aldehyde dehydrogenase family protein [Hyphomicrobium sp.]|uniref:aldehyde dehydrogenase family protein n=1 Tax=Hyphomicrobium sp. TaxID=82 RepID=UPI001D77F869|nr:aldehyde dehydrogenase family protein [Hyphomicrobium sp.]MBY0558916.1 aldehyde dehydrogenase family protein [Hyphomicrobium sp.]
MKTKSEWIDAAARFQAEARSFVDGRFVSSPNAATLEHVNPATGLPQYALALADDDLLNRAVDVARRRFDDGAWSRCHPSKRREAFLKLAALIEENSEPLALCETLDTGKAIRDSFLRDVPGSATTLRWYAEAVDKIYGETAPVGPGVLATINLQPVGVVGAVIPWNFPIETAFWKVAPALILGNSVVLKPDEKSSRSALLAAALAVEAGIPEGVFNVVTGGADLGRAMGLHPGIDALSFTGSTEVGKKFLEYSAHSNLKMISLECGGKSANVVFADTADLDRAASSAAAGIFFHQGQVCSANSRLLVEDKIADEFVEKLRKEALGYSPGAPLDPETPAGTMIGTSHRDAVLAKIAGGKREGGRVFGGVTKTVEGCDNFIEPTIVTGLAETSELAREEVFGPVLCVLPFNSEEAAIRMANDSPYALAASLWTGSFSRAHRVAARLQAGTVSVNAVDALDPALPFGGFKGSGFGRDLSLYALRNYAQPKAVWFDFRD